MKLIFLLSSLILSNFASAKVNLPVFLKLVEGKYEGTYGFFTKKQCAVHVKVEGSFPNKNVQVTLHRQDNKSNIVFIDPGFFLDLEKDDEVFVPDYFTLKFDQNQKLIAASLIKDQATFSFQRLKCKNLKKVN